MGAILTPTSWAPDVPGRVVPVANAAKIRQGVRVLRLLPHRVPPGRPRVSTETGRWWGLVITLLCGLCACRPELTAGEWVCADGAAGAAPTPTDPVSVPWSTGFEDRFCDYAEQAGFCYEAGNARYEIVRSPVHSGRYAAAFTVDTSDGQTRHQARCVRQGTLPTAAYYGAWYYIPEYAATDGKVWNLFHFQGGQDVTDRLDNLWDVSLINGDSNGLELVVYGTQARKTLLPELPTPIPIGSWFHIEMFFRRAADETGEITLYQDGTELASISDLVTDDSKFTQWYVGNYSDGVTPPTSILYVDDVSIRPE